MLAEHDVGVEFLWRLHGVGDAQNLRSETVASTTTMPTTGEEWVHGAAMATRVGTGEGRQNDGRSEERKEAEAAFKL